jgi:hypothetical protein
MPDPETERLTAQIEGSQGRRRVWEFVLRGGAGDENRTRTVSLGNSLRIMV